MTITRFDPSAPLIVVPAQIWGPHGDKWLALALDTAATETHITPEVLDDLGYKAREGGRITKVRSAVAEEPGYLREVTQFSALGVMRSQFRIHVHDLPDGFGIDGLIGLSFLRQLTLEIHFAEGMIVAR